MSVSDTFARALAGMRGHFVHATVVYVHDAGSVTSVDAFYTDLDLVPEDVDSPRAPATRRWRRYVFRSSDLSTVTFHAGRDRVTHGSDDWHVRSIEIGAGSGNVVAYCWLDVDFEES